MIDRTPRVYDVDWFNDLIAFKRLDLEPPYQRYSVWGRGYREYFIDTVLKNFPCPSIFLHKEETAEGPLYHVVDGKQRLLAIFDFQANEFPLARDRDEHSGKYFEDLPPQVRTQFGNYEIPVEILTTDSVGDLREAFDRLNRNVRRLNRQELRHARHDGPFIALMETLARERFWTTSGIGTPARVRNMRDVEFVSEIFLLTACGVQDGHPDVLDRAYAMYDDEESFQDVENHRATYEECRGVMERLGSPFLRSSRFNNLHDFYSLWAAFLHHVDVADHIDHDATRIQLQEFSERVTFPERILPNDEDGLRYSDAVRQGANKGTNRRVRAEILERLIRVR